LKSPCPVCQSPRAILVSQRDRRGRPLTTLACEECGLYRSDPLPSLAELQAFYESEYRASYKGRREPDARHIRRAARLAAERLIALAPLFPPAGVVFDVGAGAGEWLYALRSAGFQASGVELDPVYAAFGAREYQVPVTHASAFDLQFPAASFDAITVFHVLEHLPDPVEILDRYRQWLKPGGALVIEVPNLASPHQNPLRRFHYAHVLGFTPASLERAAHRAGLAVERKLASADDRNLWWLLRPAHSAPPPAPSGEAPVRDSWQQYARYALNPVTHGRSFRRLVSSLGEFAGGGGQPRQIVDRVLQSRVPRHAAPR
jgi:SAM-dependent methyltransferase